VPERKRKAKPRPLARRVALLLGATALLALAASQAWVLAGRFAAVEPGRLYRSAQMPPDRLVDLCRSRGIRTVVDFRRTEARARAESEALGRAGIRHVHLPTGQVPAPETVARFLEVMDASAGEPVLIHCTHGVGRTGVFTAVYRMEYGGWSARRAWLEAAVLAGFGSFHPGTGKARFVLGYEPRAGVARSSGRP
jgi:protein tyrosine/serine phosphatase